MKNKRLYSIYNGMKQRCNDSNHISYKYYGDKGIIVEWTNFKDFELWALSNGYADDLEIDRYNAIKVKTNENGVFSIYNTLSIIKVISKTNN